MKSLLAELNMRYFNSANRYRNLNFIKNAGILYLKVPAFYNDCY